MATTAQTNGAAPSIQITRKSTRSISAAALQAGIRPLGTRLTKPKNPAPEGSPALTPPDSVHKQCNVRPLEVEGINIYEINSRSKSTRWLFASAEYSGWQPGEVQARQSALQKPIRDPLRLDPTPSHVSEDVLCRDWAMNYDGQERRRPRYIYYFAGGGFQTPAGKEHWKLCTQLAHVLTQKGAPTTVYLVSYPLAPHSTASVTIPLLSKLYHALFPTPSAGSQNGDLSYIQTNDSYLTTSHDTKYPEIVFAGDSTGGNIALALTLHMLSTDPDAPAPDSLLLISPAVDMRNTNPEIQKIAKKDPMLTVASINQVAQAWCGADMKPDDPRVSPLLGDLSVFAKKGVAVNGVLGTYDVLAPDTQELVNKLNKEGVNGNWLIWEKQTHCFPLMSAYNASEGKEGVQWMINLLDEASKK